MLAQLRLVAVILLLLLLMLLKLLDEVSVVGGVCGRFLVEVAATVVAACMLVLLKVVVI